MGMFPPGYKSPNMGTKLVLIIVGGWAFWPGMVLLAKYSNPIGIPLIVIGIWLYIELFKMTRKESDRAWEKWKNTPKSPE